MAHPKIPETRYELQDIIHQRWSARSFANRTIAQDELNALLEAASWSASSMNEQPWLYLYAHRGSEAFNRMVDCLMPGNEPWAKNASVLLISLAKRHFDRNGKVNRHAMHDVGAANTTLLLEANARDIYGHMMGGFEMDKTLSAFDIDHEQYEVACFIALGYLDDADALEEPYQSREKTERKRKSIEEISQNLSE